MQILKIMIRIGKSFSDLLYWLLGLMAFSFSLWSSYYEVNSIIFGVQKVINPLWLLGLIPIAFFISYLVFMLFQVIQIRNLVRLLAIATSFVYILAIVAGFSNYIMLIVPIFSTISIIKLKKLRFKVKKKTRNSFSKTYFRYFLTSIAVFFELLFITFIVNKPLPDQSVSSFLADILLLINMLLAVASLSLCILFKIKTEFGNQLLVCLSNPVIIVSYKKVSFLTLLVFGALYLLIYFIALIINDI